MSINSAKRRSVTS